MSFYECLQAFPEGSDSASRLALTAKRFGYKGIIICNRSRIGYGGSKPL